MSNPFIGEIILFAGNFAPRGWALCRGQLLAVASNTALFSILGTTYGGDGETTFGLPDLRGRAAVGEGQGPGLSNHPLGSKTGSETVTLSAAQMPSHGHVVSATLNSSFGAQSGAADQHAPSPTGSLAVPTISGMTGLKFYHDTGTADTDVEGAVIGGSLTLANAGGDEGGTQAHENMHPVLAIHYIIALVGVFPSRN